MLSFGQLFGSNFWSSFKQQPSESIENLLKQADCPLEDLLDDEDILQEFKNSNKNLLKYLDREKIKKLIDFITVMPEEDEHDRGHKYPFVSNEVFNCDVNEIIDKFFISPADDVVVEDEPDEQVEAEGDNKSDGGFEKDNDGSGSDSEDEDYAHEGEEDHEKKENIEEKEDKEEKVENEEKGEDLNIEDIQNDDKKEEPEAESKETATGSEEKNDEAPVESTVEDKQEEVKLDTPQESSNSDENKKEPTDNVSSSPSTEPTSKSEETPEEPEIENKEEIEEPPTEEVQKESTNPIDSHESASPPTTVEKEEENIVEETPETQENPSTETSAQAPESQNESDEHKEQNEGDTDDASTHVSEAASEAITEAPKEPLSTNKYDLLDYLNTFIDTDQILNDVLSGYFARLLTILIQKKNEEIATYYFKNEELLYRFAFHSYSKSITDTIIKILDINTEKLEIEEAEVTRIRQEFIKRLLQRLGDHESEESYEYSLNIFQIFNELTFKKSFYAILIEKETVNALKEILLKKESPEWSSNSAIRILNVLISHLRSDLSPVNRQSATPQTFMDDNDEVVLEDDESKDQEQSLSIEEQLANHPLISFYKDNIIDNLVEFLEIPPTNPYIDFQYADNQYILGKKRLACVNLMESLVELDEASIREKILETNFYEKLFDLFLEFKHNTFLQLHLDNIFHRILKDSNTSIERKIAFLEKLKIFEKLPDFWSDNKTVLFTSQRESRHGYLAFTTRFANTLKNIAEDNEQIKEFFEKEAWQKFYTEDVEVLNEKNAINLANRGGNRKDSEEFDDLEDDKFRDMEERDDLEDEDDKEEGDEYSSNRNNVRKTLEEYDADKAREEHENDFLGETIEKDDDEDNLFSGLNGRYQDEDSDDDKPIGGSLDSSDEDSENEKEDVSEDSEFYDNSYWDLNQYSIEDLLQN